MGIFIVGCTSTTQVSAAIDVRELSRTSLILVTTPRPRAYLIHSWVSSTSGGLAVLAEEFGQQTDLEIIKNSA